MKRFLPLLLAALVAVGANAIPPAGFVVDSIPGDLDFTFGGLDPYYLTGSYIKTITVSGDVVTVEWQDADGNDGADITFTLGGGDWVDLGDTPSAITADEWLRGNTAGDALEFAVPTFTELDETPSTISADDCLMGNAAGDALMFGACTGSGGGGGGDITAVSTAANSGLAGGANSGAVDLEVDPTNAARVNTLATDDEILVADASISGALRSARLSSIVTLVDAPTDSDIDARIATYARATPSGTIATAQLPSANALDSELPDVSDFLDETEVDARIATYARVSPTGTIATAQLPSANALDSELPDVSDFVTATDVDGVFDAASFSNLTRDLVFGHYGTGTSTIPLDFLNSTNDARPAAITNVTVEQGDTVILDSGIYMYFGAVVTTIAKTGIAADDDFVQIDAVGGGGTGDITAVTTAANSGLSGGAATGAVALELDPANLPTATVITAADALVFADDSQSDAPHNITLGDFTAHLGGHGLEETTDGRLEIDFEGMARTTSLAPGEDEIVFQDTSLDDARIIEIADFMGEVADGTDGIETDSTTGVIGLTDGITRASVP